MTLDWSSFVEFIRQHQQFMIVTHTRPDGDALGSQLAVAEALESLGKSVVRAIPSRMPPRYEFMDPARQVESSQEVIAEKFKSCDAVLVVDTGTWNQLAGLAELIRSSSAKTFVIDHHQTQDDLGGGRIVDTSSESCGRLAHAAIRALNVSVTPTMAQNCFIAMATDTGWFRHSNTSPAAFSLAAELMSAGARPTEAFERIYETSNLPRLLLLGRALDRLTTIADGKLAYSEIHAGDYSETGAIPPDTEDLINYPRSIAGVEVAIMFMEQPEGGIKVSFRSNKIVDVAKLAEQFQGGGHKRAAGATLPGALPAARERVLAAAKKALEAG